MRKKLWLSALCGCLALLSQAQFTEEVQSSLTTGEGNLIRTTVPLRQWRPDPAFKDIPVRDENGRIKKPGQETKSPLPPNYDNEPALMGLDPVLQAEAASLQASLGANWNGMGFTNVNPPDPSVAVGPNHVIQMINGSSGAYFRIYNKAGSPLSNQIYLDQVTGRGGLGDPIVLYDHLADRFVMTEFANRSETGSEGLVMAVSQTSDPLGSWYIYYFSTGTTFPDYPKFSVWPDGYYATSNDFANASSYNGSTVYAFDRARMLAGLSVTGFQSVKFSTTSYTKYFAMCPVLWQGNTAPPAGTGGLIAYMFEDSWTSTTADRDSVGLIEFRVNWTNPSQSSIVNLSSLPTTAFKSQICTASRGACIPQPGTTTRLEALHMRVMNQPIYRNFNGTEGIVLSFAVDVGSSRSGIRWYELRKSGANPWGIYQESTYSLNDDIHRWMSSIAYDGAGNIGLAYNVSAANNTFPGVRYTGRRSCDPLNTMTFAEGVIVNGTSRNSSSRYGDYNHLIADPSGQSFWFTAQWNASTSWSTRIANFSLGDCEAAPCNAPAGLSSSNITSNSATVSWGAVSGAQSYTVEYKTTSASSWTVAASATTSTSVNLSALAASTTYDWRVRTNCNSANSEFAQAQFTTAAAVTCNAPTGLSSSNITSNSATVSWGAVSGAQSYTVEYKTTSASSWTLAASATTSTSVNLSALAASTTYDWRVRTNCSSGSSGFTASQFTTLPDAGACTDPFEPNDVSAQAAPITPGSAISAKICSASDRDWFTFTNNNQNRNVRVTLSVPAGVVYDMRLIRPNGQIAGTTSGTASVKTLTFSGNPTGAYRVEVYSTSGFSETANYGLLAEISSSSFAPTLSARDTEELTVSGLTAYPNPARGQLTLVFEAPQSGDADVRLLDANGRVANARRMGVVEGMNFTTLDVSRLPAGMVLVQVQVAGRLMTRKVMIER